MVALFVRLKLTLMRNGLRRSVWKLVGLILGGLYGLAIVGFAVFGLVALRFAGIQIAGSVTVVAFSVLTIGWLVFSLLVFGVDETVDPSRFALLPVPARRLAPGLLVAALIGLPGVATTLVALALLGTWSTGAATVVATIITIPVGVVLCVLWARAVTGMFARALASRRTRDIAIVLMMLVTVGLSLGGQLIGRVAGTRDPRALLAVLHTAGTVLGWTPFGWIWAVPGAAAGGQWASAGVHLVLALALAGVLVVVWVRSLERNLTSPIESGEGGKAVKTTGLVENLYPHTPAGAIAGRGLRYWRRDPRYLSALVGLIVLPVVIVVSQLATGNSSHTLVAYAPIFTALMTAPSMASDLAYDGSAVSLHILSGIRGREDRIGRAMSGMTILAPLLVIMMIVCTVLSGSAEQLVRVTSLVIVLLLAGMGVALWVGTFVPGKAPAPGSSPFSSGNNGGLQGLVSFGISAGLTAVAALPPLPWWLPRSGSSGCSGLRCRWLWSPAWSSCSSGSTGAASCWSGGGPSYSRRCPRSSSAQPVAVERDRIGARRRILGGWGTAAGAERGVCPVSPGVTTSSG